MTARRAPLHAAPRMTWIVGVLAVLVTAACHHTPRAGDVIMSPTVEIQVTNNLSPPDQVTVYIVDENRGRQMLGTVSPGRVAKFSFQPNSATNRFQLVAQPSNGRSVLSSPFTLTDARIIAWDMRSSLIQVYTQ